MYCFIVFAFLPLDKMNLGFAPEMVTAPAVVAGRCTHCCAANNLFVGPACRAGFLPPSTKYRV